MELFDLSGRVAIVTGGNGGIGLGMAEGLAKPAPLSLSRPATARNRKRRWRRWRRPARRARSSRSTSPIRTYAGRWCAAPLSALAGSTSWSTMPACRSASRREDYAVAEWHTVLDTNLTGPLVCCQAAYPVMQRQGGGKIINIGSMMSIFGAAYAAAYAASKGAIVQLTRSLGDRLGPGQYPGQRGVAGLDRHRADDRGAPSRSQGLHERILRRTPAGRWGVPTDMAGHRGVPRRPGLRFRDRHGDPGRWRLLGRVLTRTAAAASTPRFPCRQGIVAIRPHPARIPL